MHSINHKQNLRIDWKFGNKLILSFLSISWTTHVKKGKLHFFPKIKKSLQLCFRVTYFLWLFYQMLICGAEFPIWLSYGDIIIICLTEWKSPTFEGTIVWERWYFWRSEINIDNHLIQCITCYFSWLPIFKLSLQVPWIDSNTQLCNIFSSIFWYLTFHPSEIINCPCLTLIYEIWCSTKSFNLHRLQTFFWSVYVIKITC